MSTFATSTSNDISLLQALDGRVHVWRWALRRDPEVLERAWNTINLMEKARAEQMPSTSKREMFVLRRSTLRSVLGRYLDCAPVDVDLVQESCGRPTVTPDGCQPDIQMNLSHSNGTVLIAVSKGTSIGIDVEYQNDVNAAIASDRIEPRFSNFVEHLRLACPEGRTAGHTAHWTGIEALVKATGLRLADDQALAAFCRHDAANYWIRWLPLEPGIVAAIAGHGSVPSLQILTWQDC